MIKGVLKALYLNTRKTLLHLLGLFLMQKEQTTPNLGNIKHVLFIRIDRIGDLVLSTPAIRSIKEHLPSATLTVLASRVNHSILDHNPFVDKVHLYEKKDFLKKWMICLELLKAHFDLTIDPVVDYTIESSLLSFLSGAGVRAGYAGYGREVFYTHPAVLPEKPMHMAELTLYILHHIGIPSAANKPELYISERERIWANEWLRNHGLPGDRLVIALHPGAHYKSQKWPVDYYRELADRLCESNAYVPIVLGAPAERQEVEEIAQPYRNRISHFISDNLRDFASLLSLTNALVCNNSGPLHVATALNIPTISFMGPTEKEKWLPLGDRNIVLRMDNLSCIGCNLSNCKIKTHDCMRLITPDTVMNSVAELMKAKS
jgi:lipopolysaccharide heptosyltransferase II